VHVAGRAVVDDGDLRRFGHGESLERVNDARG
jgi:hypothetical protein